MALTKVRIIDKKDILESGKIQVREAIRIMEDGVCISQTFHRYCLAPTDDVSNQPQDIKDITAVVWTDEVKAAWTAKVAKENPE